MYGFPFSPLSMLSTHGRRKISLRFRPSKAIACLNFISSFLMLKN
nr:MAG TPA: hypothetical protein [Caudoviricetes sp.]